ncbi:MAG: hypothetical protein ACTSRW_12135 [Candidatus Helarchaeota archaeon]
MDEKEREKLYKKIKKLMEKGLRLINDERWNKALDILEEAGNMAVNIGDKELELKISRQMEKCMLQLQDIMEEEEKKIEDKFSELY